MQSLVECLVKQKVKFFLLAIGTHLVLLTQLWQQDMVVCSLDSLFTTYCADSEKLQLQALYGSSQGVHTHVGHKYAHAYEQAGQCCISQLFCSCCLNPRWQYV